MWNPFRKKKELTVKEELQRISDRLDKAWSDYEKKPNLRNTLYLDGLLRITEKLVSNIEKTLEV